AGQRGAGTGGGHLRAGGGVGAGAATGGAGRHRPGAAARGPPAVARARGADQPARGRQLDGLRTAGAQIDHRPAPPVRPRGAAAPRRLRLGTPANRCPLLEQGAPVQAGASAGRPGSGWPSPQGAPVGTFCLSRAPLIRLEQLAGCPAQTATTTTSIGTAASGSSAQREAAYAARWATWAGSSDGRTRSWAAVTCTAVTVVASSDSRIAASAASRTSAAQSAAE